jgi:hypothetical protein
MVFGLIVKLLIDSGGTPPQYSSPSKAEKLATRALNKIGEPVGDNDLNAVQLPNGGSIFVKLDKSWPSRDIDLQLVKEGRGWTILRKNIVSSAGCGGDGGGNSWSEEGSLDVAPDASSYQDVTRQDLTGSDTQKDLPEPVKDAGKDSGSSDVGAPDASDASDVADAFVKDVFEIFSDTKDAISETIDATIGDFLDGFTGEDVGDDTGTCLPASTNEISCDNKDDNCNEIVDEGCSVPGDYLVVAGYMGLPLPANHIDKEAFSDLLTSDSPTPSWGAKVVFGGDPALGIKMCKYSYLADSCKNGEEAPVGALEAANSLTFLGGPPSGNEWALKAGTDGIAKLVASPTAKILVFGPTAPIENAACVYIYNAFACEL